MTTSKKVKDYLKTYPGSSFGEIKEALRLVESTLASCLTRQFKKGKIVRQGRERNYKYFNSGEDSSVTPVENTPIRPINSEEKLLVNLENALGAIIEYRIADSMAKTLREHEKEILLKNAEINRLRALLDEAESKAARKFGLSLFGK